MSMKVELKTQWHGKEVKIRGKEVVGQSIWGVGLVVEGQAKMLCARRYGYLAASINTQASDGKSTEVENPNKYAREKPPANHSVSTFDKIAKPVEPLEVYVGSHVDYSPYVEFGSVRSHAQPFLRPALELAKGHVLTIVQLNGKMHFKEYLTEKDSYKYRNQ